MALGGLSGVGSGASHNQAGQGAGAGGESAGKEFSLEKQQTSSVGGADIAKKLRGKTTQIIDRKKRNRKGSPRTIIVDGDIYEVFLLAIA